MQIVPGCAGQEAAITAMVRTTFAAAYDTAEGEGVSALIHDLMTATPEGDRIVFHAAAEGKVIAAVAFSRLTYPEDLHRVALLSPMAVAPGWQRRGVGQALIGAALPAVRAAGYDVAITYGDPAYYGRFGFLPISTDQAQPPLPLGMPHGWLGQSLTGGPMPRLRGPSVCVPALNRPALW